MLRQICYAPRLRPRYDPGVDEAVDVDVGRHDDNGRLVASFTYEAKPKADRDRDREPQR